MSKEYSPKILVVEDDKNIREMLQLILTNSGFSPQVCESAESAKLILAQSQPDLMLLDLMLPGQDGLIFARALRRESQFEKLPIIMLTARGIESVRVAGLELADDYIVKPFSPKELIARIQAVLRRIILSHKPKTKNIQEINVGDIHINSQTMKVLIKAREIVLTLTEFNLFKFLAENAGGIVTRQTLLNEVWQDEGETSLRAVDATIRRLRKQINAHGFVGERIIETVRGVGYRLKVE